MLQLRPLVILAAACAILVVPSAGSRHDGSHAVVYETVTVVAGAEPTGLPANNHAPPGKSDPDKNSGITPSSSSDDQEDKKGPSYGNEGDNNSGGQYLSVANKWRKQIGKGGLTSDNKLAANAHKTGLAHNSANPHQLNPGTHAQVITMGVPTWTGAWIMWLCERPEMAGLAGVCKDGATPGGETGHADILSSNQYTKIGCAQPNDWIICDLA